MLLAYSPAPPENVAVPATSALAPASIASGAVSVVMLGWVNRIGGIIFGLLLGVIFSGAILAILVKFLGINTIIEESILATILLDRFPIVLALLPDNFDTIRSFFQ